ncbi:MAG: hypothetical protein AAF546_07185 [Verrucomicrobiota bacterium]
MKVFSSLILALIPALLSGKYKQYFDYNFDGYDDYRVWRESDGRLAYYDIYLYLENKKEFEKHLGLSQLYNPTPNKEKKEVECFWPGGHASLIHSTEVYVWEGKILKLSRVTSQDYVKVGDAWEYIRVTASIHEGKPRIEKIEHIPNVLK